MKQKRNASVRVAARSEAEEPAASRGTTDSNKEYITAASRVQGPIESLLLYGETNAISTARLVQLAGMRDARQLQSQIERERIDGALILSRGGSGGGYFLPADRAEIAKYESTLRRRALSTLRTIRSARAALRVLPGQEVIANEREV